MAILGKKDVPVVNVDDEGRIRIPNKLLGLEKKVLVIPAGRRIVLIPHIFRTCRGSYIMASC